MNKYKSLFVDLHILEYFNSLFGHTTYIYKLKSIVSLIIGVILVFIYTYNLSWLTVGEGDLKTFFSIAITPRSRGGRYAFS